MILMLQGQDAQTNGLISDSSGEMSVNQLLVFATQQLPS